MLQTEANLLGYQQNLKKKKRNKTKESNGTLLQICLSSTVSLEEPDLKSPATAEREGGEAERRPKKKKHKERKLKDINEVTVVLSDEQTVQEQQTHKKRKRPREPECERGAPVVSIPTGKLMKKIKRVEVTDTAENTLKVPDGNVVTRVGKVQRRLREVEEVKNQQPEVEDYCVPIDAEVDGELRRKKKKKKNQQPEVEDYCVPMGAEVDGELRKKKKNQQPEVEDYCVPIGAEVVGELRRKKKKKNNQQPEVEDYCVPIGAEVDGELRKKNKNQQPEVEDYCVPIGAEVDGEVKKKKKQQQDDRKTNCVEGTVVTSEHHRREAEKSHGNHEHNSVSAGVTDISVGHTSEDVIDVSGDFRDSEDSLVEPHTQMCVEELKEFIPDVEKKSSSAVDKLIKYELPRLKMLKEKGISFRRGRFTAEENDRLLQNVKDFLCLSGIDNGAKLFFTRRYPDERQHINKMKRQHRFLMCLADGIPRLRSDVWSRGRKIFDSYGYKGRFMEDDIKNLKKFHTLYGNNWMKISELTGRSNAALEKRFSQIGDKKGSWTESEEKELVKLVKDYMLTQVEPGQSDLTIRREKLYSNIPWKNIAGQLKTRSWTQCRVKWMSILTKMMSSGAVLYKGKKSLKPKIKMIKALYKMNLEDEADVKWENLTHIIGDVPPAYVQGKFYKLKVTRVPGWQRMSFTDIIDYLYVVVKPELEVDLKHCKKKKEEEESQTTRDVFRFSEIFEDVQE